MNSADFADAEILAVSIDSKANLQRLADLLSKEDGKPLDFPFLSDADHKVINRYGILNPSSKSLPHPATYVIDKQGVVRWKFVEVDYRVRPTNDQILAALKNLR